MHGQSVGPFYTQQRDKDGLGEEEMEGLGRRGRGEGNKDLWFNL